MPLEIQFPEVKVTIPTDGITKIITDFQSQGGETNGSFTIYFGNSDFERRSLGDSSHRSSRSGSMRSSFGTVPSPMSDSPLTRTVSSEMSSSVQPGMIGSNQTVPSEMSSVQPGMIGSNQTVPSDGDSDDDSEIDCLTSIWPA